MSRGEPVAAKTPRTERACERMYRGPLNVDELLAELHASENDPNGRAFLGAGRQCRGGGAAVPSCPKDVSDAMSRMQERLDRLNGEVHVQLIGASRSGLPPPHGRRAGVAAAADEARRRGGDEAVGGTELVALAALEQAARRDTQREMALRQRVAALHQQLEPVAATAPAAEGAATVAVKRPAAPAAAEAQGRQLSAAVGRRVAQLKRQASARAAVLDGLECEVRRLLLQQQQQQQQQQHGGAPPAAEPAEPAAPAAEPMGQPARLLCMLRRINEAVGAAEVGTAPLASGAQGLGRVHGLGAASASAQRACVPCSVFSDGVMMHRGPFRPYAEAAPFVREVMAGYLPYELKQRHPGGVLFEPLLDFCHATYAEAAASAVAARGGGGGGGGGVVDLQALHAGSDLLVPQGRLLERLPKSVLRNGAVVPVRDEIAALVGGRGAEAGAPAADGEAVRAARVRRFAR